MRTAEISFEDRVKAVLSRAIRPAALRRYSMGFLVLPIITAGVLLVYRMATPGIYEAAAFVLPSSPTVLSEAKEMITAQTGASDYLLKLFALDAKMKRLDAELRSTDVSFEGIDASSPQEQAILQRELSLNASRKTSWEQAGASLHSKLDLLEAEVAALEEQVKYAGMEQASIDKEVANVRGLAAKNLALGSRLGDVERSAAVIASRRIELETELLDRKQAVVSGREEISTLDNDRRTDILTEMQDVELDRRTAQSQLQAARLIQSINASSRPVDAASIEDKIAVMRSDQALGPLVASLGLANDEFINRNIIGFLNRDMPPSTSRGEELSELDLAKRVLRRDAEIARWGRGSSLRVSFRSVNASTAVAVANAIASFGLSRVGVSGGDGQPPGELLQQATLVNGRTGLLSTLLLGLVMGAVLWLVTAVSLSTFKELRSEWPASSDELR